MSHFIIKDGRGTGGAAKVDDHGRLYTRSNYVSHMSHHATYHKNAYIKSFETTLAGATETPCAFLQNTDSTKDIEIYWLRISSDANVEFNIYSDNDYVSGGNSVKLINTNLGQPTSLDVNTYEGGASANLALLTTHNFLMDGGFVPAYGLFDSDYQGGLVLGNTRSVAIKVTGALNDKIKITMGLSLHTEGTKL